MKRIVCDTNILVAAAYNSRSASHRIVIAAERGELELVVSPAVLREYEYILPRAVRLPERLQWLQTIIAAAAVVSRTRTRP